jgi:hypothetical protein
VADPGEFLSEEWLQSLGRRLATAVPPDAGPLRLGVVVTGAPSGGEISYTLSIGGSAGSAGSGVEIGSVADAEVVLVESYEDARALASGLVAASQLLEQGRLKVRGDANRLVAAGDTLRAIGEAFGTVEP